MLGSSESWGPQQRPLPWRSRAGGGAVHGIRSGHQALKLRCPLCPRKRPLLARGSRKFRAQRPGCRREMPAKGPDVRHCYSQIVRWFSCRNSSRPSQREILQMIFGFFALAIAAAFFASSLILLNYGRHLGLRYLQQKKDAANMAGLATVEGAVFALIGLLLAFTISGALQRFDERRQLVLQEANAASTAHDRLGLFEGDVGRNLQTKLKDYVEARIDLYRMSHDFSLWRHSELFSSEQQGKIVDLKNKLLDATVAACPEASFRPPCAQTLPALAQFIRSRATAPWRQRKTSASDCLCYAVRPWPWRFSARRLRHGRGHGAQLDTYAGFRLDPNGYTLRCYGHGVSAARPRFASRISITFLSMLTSKCNRGTASEPLLPDDKTRFRSGSFATDRSSANVQALSAPSPIATELLCRRETTLRAISGHRILSSAAFSRRSC